MPISATEPASRARRMVRTLFRPFSLSAWFVVGFCAFLATCGENANTQFTFPRSFMPMGRWTAPPMPMMPTPLPGPRPAPGPTSPSTPGTPQSPAVPANPGSPAVPVTGGDASSTPQAPASDDDDDDGPATPPSSPAEASPSYPAPPGPTTGSSKVVHSRSYVATTYRVSGPPRTLKDFFGFDPVDWLKNNMGFAVGVGLVALACGIGVTLFWAWIKSRGRFMFIDNLARNRPAVVEPWNRLAGLANSLFRARLGLIALGWLVLLLALTVSLAMTWSSIVAHQVTLSVALPAIIVGGLLWLMLFIALAGAGFMLEQVVVPVMYARRVRVIEAWRIVRAEVIPGNAGALVVFLLMRIALQLGAIMIMGTMGCCSCCLLCIPSLPYLGTVFFLPIYVFLECYTLSFMEQFGTAFRIFEDHGRSCSVCGYDLRGNPLATNCPECGATVPPPDLGPAGFAGASAPPSPAGPIT